MIIKIKNIIRRFLKNQEEILKLNKEIEWANVYHDSIRGKKCFEELPLNIGRWAGNYSFFYVLNRILDDYKPEMILEFGLGESTKFIMTFINNYSLNTKHVVVEQDENWMQLFQKKFRFSNNSQIKIIPIKKQIIHGFKSSSYENLSSIITNKFDLYVIDGPFGSPNYSRYDIVYLVSNFNQKDEFIIIIDDYNRIGEKQTVADLLKIFISNNIIVHTQNYSGVKDVFVIATNKYKYACSL